MDIPIIPAIVGVLFLTLMTIANVEWCAPWHPGLFSKFIWRKKKKVKKVWTKKERSAYRVKAYAVRVATVVIFIIIFVIYDATTSG